MGRPKTKLLIKCKICNDFTDNKVYCSIKCRYLDLEKKICKKQSSESNEKRRISCKEGSLRSWIGADARRKQSSLDQSILAKRLWQSEEYIKNHEKRGRFRHIKINIVCLGCKISFNGEIDRKYCSRICYLQHVIPWNKGLTKESDKRVDESSKKQKEDCLNGRRLPNNGHPGFYASDLGHWVRSGWEANFERLLKAIKIDYEYEKHRFKLANGEIYIPDFYLPLYKTFIEIKGSKFKKCCDMFDKPKRFISEKHGDLVIIDEVIYAFIERLSKNVVTNWGMRQ